MNQPVEHGVAKDVDTLQRRFTEYACNLRYEDLTPAAVHATKLRIIDTLGALVGGFFGEPCAIARNMAAQLPTPNGATVLGTRTVTSPDLAAFANATTSRFVEANDCYHWPGSRLGHPSDVVMPILAAAEHAHASGRDFITAVVLGYELYLRLCDSVHYAGFDAVGFSCLGTGAAAAKLWGLNAHQMSHCLSMAVVPNNILKQVRTGHLSMWKAVAAGHAGRCGLFAAMLARAGMEGPHMPFEGKAGWLDHVARERFAIDELGGNGVEFKVEHTLIKPRTSCATTISSILAAEKAALQLKDIAGIEHVTVEVYKQAKEGKGTGAHNWNPDSRETADHSIPYVVTATLIDGTITPSSFGDARLWNPELRALLQKVEIVANDEFTALYDRHPVEHHTRVTVRMRDGTQFSGEAGGDKGDLSWPKSDAEISTKFRGLCEEAWGTKRTDAILERLWNLETMDDVAAIAPACVMI